MKHEFTVHWETGRRSFCKSFDTLEEAQKKARKVSENPKTGYVHITEEESENTPELLRVRVLNFNCPF